MCIYNYIYLQKEREREYERICIFHYWSIMFLLIQVDIIYSTRGRSSILPGRELIILPDTPKWIPKRQSSGLPLRWRGGSQAIGYRDSSLKLPRVSMDNLLGLASCMISPKALVAALRTWWKKRVASKMVSRSISCKIHCISIEIIILFPSKYSISIEIFLWYWWWWSYDVHSPIFRVRKPSALDSGGEISDWSRHNTPVASWGHLFWWPSGVDVLLDLVCESSNSGCWPIRLPVLKYQTMMIY